MGLQVHTEQLQLLRNETLSPPLSLSLSLPPSLSLSLSLSLSPPSPLSLSLSLPYDTCSTFSYTNIFADAADGPISTPTVLKLSGDGTLQETWGAGIFYLPHSVTLDESGGLWFTDVALHQVLKFDGLDSQEPSLTLGHELTPGAKPGYFCKPADVAVASSGKFYVADGYVEESKAYILYTWPQ